MKTLDAILAAVNNKGLAIDTGELLGHCLHEWKGTKGLANELRKEFESLPEGHASRVKILITLLQSALNHENKGDGLPDDPETLRAILDQYASGEVETEPDDDTDDVDDD